MSWMRFFRRLKWDEERARELQNYLEFETEKNIESGLNPDDAPLAAQRRLGNATIARGEIFHMNSIGSLEARVDPMVTLRYE